MQFLKLSFLRGLYSFGDVNVEQVLTLVDGICFQIPVPFLKRCFLRLVSILGQSRGDGEVPPHH